MQKVKHQLSLKLAAPGSTCPRLTTEEQRELVRLLAQMLFEVATVRNAALQGGGDDDCQDQR